MIEHLWPLYDAPPTRFAVMRMRRELQPKLRDARFAVLIKDLEVSDRTVNVLGSAGIETVADLYASPVRVLSIPNFGRKCHVQLNEALTARGWANV